MVKEYDCTVSIPLGKNAEWIPSEMTFKDLYQDWEIHISKQGFNARCQRHKEPTETELAGFEKEIGEVASRLLKALRYLMNVKTRRSQPRPPS